MAKFLLKQNAHIDGTFHGFGSVVDLTEAQAAELADIITTPDGAAAKADKKAEGSHEGAEDLSKLTKAQLSERLADLGEAVDPNASKAELLAQLEAAAK